MLHVSGLRKVLGGRLAVEGLTLEIAAGETVGLVGPNGAGKSTTLGLLAGLLEPDAGRVSLGPARLKPSSAAGRRLIGLVPQELALYPDLTAEENLFFFGRLYGLSGCGLRERAARLLQGFGLADRRKDRVGSFSGGMQRRLNLACALLHDPRIVLLDEPTVGIDPHSRHHVLDAIDSLRKEGLTIVYSTHYMEEIEQLCDRVAIVDRGVLRAFDTVPALVERYGGTAVVDAELELDGSAARLAREAIDRAISGVTWDDSGTKLRWHASDPSVALAQMAALKVPLRALRLEPPGLEQVFLALTGRALKDYP